MASSMILTVGQMVIVTPFDGLPYQLGPGDILTVELVKDIDIACVELVELKDHVVTVSVMTSKEPVG